jgi:2-C-methyl-D-erythritol 4-phosphate cytidylyltransferase
MGEATPKQYLELAGHPLIHHTLRRIAAHPLISGVFIVLASDDARFRALGPRECPQRVEALYCGGATRAASVYNGLIAARDAIAGDDWVLVHDAARPCLTAVALDRLIAEIGDDEVGGLLAVPVADTLKRRDRDGRVSATEARESLWQAQTPQMFRYELLVEALRRAGPATVTDEAAAIERMGLKPKLVMGEARNFKVTRSEDLELAELVLREKPGAR